jgi:hypothetical protein
MTSYAQIDSKKGGIAAQGLAQVVHTASRGNQMDPLQWKPSITSTQCKQTDSNTALMP